MAEVFIDYSTASSPWWDAARARCEQLSPDDAGFIRVMQAVYAQWGAARIDVDDGDVRRFTQVAASLPGWDDDPILVEPG